ncbi:MAG: hypothetical protein AAGU05_08440 [Anaerolineaceae bacterium]
METNMAGLTRGVENDGDYVFLACIPDVPVSETPSRKDCDGYAYMTMVQLCNIAVSHGMTRSRACNDFGGDKGKYQVEPTRKARAIMVGNKLRKFVLVSAAVDYFRQENIDW